MYIDFENSETPEGKNSWEEFIESVNKLLDKYSIIAVGIFGICTIILIGVLIYRFSQLSIVASDPTKKKKAMQGILFTSIAMSLMGGFTVFLCLFYNFF